MQNSRRKFIQNASLVLAGASLKPTVLWSKNDTIAKVKRINKPYARKIQILTVLEQRAKVSGKTEQAVLAKKAKEQLKRKHENDKRKV